MFASTSSLSTASGGSAAGGGGSTASVRSNSPNDVLIQKPISPTTTTATKTRRLAASGNGSVTPPNDLASLIPQMPHSLMIPCSSSSTTSSALPSCSSASVSTTSDVCFPLVDAHQFTDAQQASLVMANLSQFRQDAHLCDVELEAEGRTISAHRYVLAAAIPYFQAMFSSNMVETTMQRIKINDISYDSLRQLVEFVYTSEILIDGENVQNLLFAASILQMDSVCAACQRFLTQFLTTKNCLMIRQFAERHNCVDLLGSTDDFAVDNFTELRELPEFKTIPYSHLRDLIKRSDLKVNCEEEVFETVIEWIETDRNARVAYLPDLVSLVRLPQLQMRYLCDTVKEHDLIRNCRECQDMVSEAVFKMLSKYKGVSLPIGVAIFEESGGQYAASSSTNNAIPRPLSPRTQATQCHPRKSVAGVIFCAGGRGTAGDPFRSVEAYDWRKNRWLPVAEMTQQRRHVGVVSASGKLYAIGGHDGLSHLSTAEVFDPQTGFWRRCAPMKTSRRGIAVAALDAAIYAVGGLDDSTCFSTVERYDIDQDTWATVASMNIQRGGVGVSALGKYLFAIGGNDGTSSLDSCERYDPLLDRWKIVHKMTNRRAGAGVCVLDGALYAVGGFDDNAPLSTCERYDPHQDCWVQLANMTCPRGGVGVAAMGGMVYAIGGHDGSRYLNTVEAYNPVTNAWTEVADIKECRAGAGVAWASCRMDDLLRPQQDSGCAPSAGSHCV